MAVNGWFLVASKERYWKQRPLLESLGAGMPPKHARLCTGFPPVPGAPFISVGQLWAVERLVPPALQGRTPFWLVDNGFHLSGGALGVGPRTGYFRVTYRGFTPVLLNEADTTRLPVEFAPWREPTSRGHVLIAMPGPNFGRAAGMDMGAWCRFIAGEVRKNTDRPIVVREKSSRGPLERDLRGCHVLVTHSSSVAVEAVRLGVPVVVASTNPAAPVGSTFLSDIENPRTPNREHWWASLMCQQFTQAEMRSGTAWHWMQKVMRQVDEASASAGIGSMSVGRR